MYIERIKDDQPLFQGTQQCKTWLATKLNDPGSDFLSCGATAGLYVENATDGSHGVAADITEDYMTVALTGGSLNVWTNGDTYKIYATATKNATLSRIYMDKRFGRKVTDKKALVGGLFLRDIDDDEYVDNVFSEGQPYPGDL